MYVPHGDDDNDPDPEMRFRSVELRDEKDVLAPLMQADIDIDPSDFARLVAIHTKDTAARHFVVVPSRGRRALVKSTETKKAEREVREAEKRRPDESDAALAIRRAEAREAARKSRAKDRTRMLRNQRRRLRAKAARVAAAIAEKGDAKAFDTLRQVMGGVKKPSPKHPPPQEYAGHMQAQAAESKEQQAIFDRDERAGRGGGSLGKTRRWQIVPVPDSAGDAAPHQPNEAGQGTRPGRHDQ
jgi:hypothetical protein